MNSLTIAATLLLAGAAPAAAPPTQLQCRLPAEDGGEALWRITLHEGDGEVEYSNAATAAPVRRRAVFSATGVRFGTLAIDRRSGAFTRKDSFSGLSFLVEGTCSPADADVSRRTGP